MLLNFWSKVGSRALFENKIKYYVNIPYLSSNLFNKILCTLDNFKRHKKTHENNPKQCMKTDKEYQSKFDIVSKINLKSQLHAAPFLKLPIHTLLQIYKTTKADEKNGLCENRLYYIASRLNCPPSMLSERVARRTFIYSLSFDWIENSLNVLLELGVTGDRIIRDLWVLKYQHTTIRNRLQKIKDQGIKRLYPWMVRCSEDVLHRYIELFQETKSILGDDKRTIEYIAKRLNTTEDVVEDMYSKVPGFETIRVTKVKSFIDFLIEEGYTVEDIISRPRVFAASQKTVKQRLDKLRELGMTQINLNVLCRSRKDFKRYCESIEASYRE
ncbi:transcription termination factor, mitochondrial [Leptidea sinapis]|uniref:Transcription termination factor, mitochondrial n=1 Tax=Leptidea sinapis TaxID=189913 RepID=A0A5E4R9G4_9NEOP|nr:transcription termination factor, mitochondrial [Leptidea sinapis]VVD05833.1 unnamed protein product [Leptidea sinapis]